MQIHEEKDGDIMVVAPSQSLDSVTSQEFENRLIELIDQGERNLLLDMSSLNYVNSAGLKALLLAAKRLDSNGKIVLCGIQSNVYMVFELTGFDKLFTITADRAEARAAFS